MIDFDAYVSPSQAGRILGLSPSRVKQLVDDGSIAALSTPLGRLISRESVQALAEQRRRRDQGDGPAPEAA
jgi:hypothetical protein